MSTFIKTGLVPNYPTLIVCGFTMIAAIQSFFTGLMLQTIVQKNRQDFEMELKKAAVWKTICVKEEKEQDALDPGFHANEGSHYNSSRYSRIL